jgi:hypothetical protein
LYKERNKKSEMMQQQFMFARVVGTGGVSSFAMTKIPVSELIRFLCGKVGVEETQSQN